MLRLLIHLFAAATAARARLARLPSRGLAIFAMAFVVLEIIEVYVQPYTPDGVHFQKWTSEVLMQSVSVRELRASPVETLWYLHIQPPVHNALRAIFAAWHDGTTWTDLINRVDRDLYHAWAVASAVLTALVDAWLRHLRVPPRLAAVLALCWFLHPANLAYATLLDATLLSALLTTWILYEVWRLSRLPASSLVPLGGAVLLAYFTRAVYQWPFLLVIAGSLLLLRVPRRRVATFASVLAVVIGLYSAKQEYLFGTISTTTLRGTNLVSAIGAACPPNQVARGPGRSQSGPAVLVEPLKADNSPNFNYLDHLDDERNLLACFRRNLAERSLGSIGSAYVANFELFIRPSSDYWPNPLIDRVPWRRFFDGAFSGRPLVWISLGVSVLSLWRARQRLRAALALALPAGYVFLVCVTAEHGENMRFKFFLEPAIYVWWAAQSFAAGRAAAAAARRVWVSALADAVSPQVAGDG